MNEDAAGLRALRVLTAELSERQQMERELRESIRWLRLSEQATSELATALSAEDVAEVLLAFCERALGAAAGVVYLTREDETQLHLCGARGVPPAGQIPILTPDMPVPLATAVKRREGVWIESYEQLIERYPNLLNARTQKERLQSVMAIPLLHVGRLVGGVALSFSNRRSFEDDERAWIVSLAAQSAVAAERARLYEAEKRARAEAETLFRIAESLTAAQLDLQVIVQRLTDEATALVGANFGAFFYNVTDERGETYLLYALSGAPQEAFAKFGLPRNTPIFAPTFAGEGVVRLADVRKDPRYGTMPPHYGMPKGHLPVVSYLAVPVVSRTGPVLGGLFFGHRDAGRFSEQHERMVKALAAAAAAAIDNARSFQAAREAEEQQRRLVSELLETVRLNELFAGVLAHDLRNPLSAILSSAQLALLHLRQAHAAKLERPLARISLSGERMARMIDQLLDFTRIRVGGGMTLEPKAGDILQLVRRISEELEGAHPELVFRIDSAGDGAGLWDPDRLGQVFSNLLGNAVQHGHRDQSIEVRVDGSEPEQVRVSVSNAGSIPADVVSTLFMPLSRQDRGRDKSSGLGLGLFISQEIARAHGGSISVQSGAQSTTFVLSLPRFCSADSARHEPTQSRRTTNTEAVELARQAPAAYGENAQKFRILVESVKDYAIFMLDREGRIASWNAGAERIKGYAARDIIGQHFSCFYDPTDVQAGQCSRALERAADEGRYESEGWRLRKDGSKFWANVVITALRDDRGELLGFAKVTRDLTERRKLEDERLRRAQAEEALRLRDDFLAIAAHELRTPLTILKLQLDVLQERSPELDASLNRTVVRARRGIDRLSRLVESLLEVTRIATDTFTLFREPFDLADALAEVLATVQADANAVGTRLFVDIQGPLLGSWDRRRMQQVVTNLIWNALTHAAGAPVRILARGEAQQVVLEVVDQGPGIRSEDLERIFGRFERAGAVRDRAGLGLGLYIVRQIIERHGGSVEVESAPGRGARFVARLPMELANPPSNDRSSS